MEGISRTFTNAAVPVTHARRVHRRALSLLAATTVVSIVVTASFTADAQSTAFWYVSPSGSDANSGTETQPFRTIQHAADLVRPGDTVIVEDGTYTGTGTGTACAPATRPVLCLARGGTSGNVVTFRARHRLGAKLNGANNTSTDGIRLLSGANFIRIEGFEIYGVGNASGASSGIEAYEGGADVVLIHNDIHDVGRLCTDTTNGQVGIYIQQPRVRTEGNRIHDIGRFAPGESGCSPSTTYYQNHDHGIYVNGTAESSAIPGATDAFIDNNVFFNCRRGWCVQVYAGTVSRLTIVNNTFAFANPYQDGHIILGAPTTDAQIANNVFYGPRTAAIDYFRGTQTNLQVRNNVVYNAALFDAVPAGSAVSGTLLTDPLLLKPTAAPYDFHLTTASPAINAGVSVTGFTTDYDGGSRADGRFDIGAYEFGAVSGPPAVPTNLRIIR